MGYQKTDWKTGDIVSSQKMNKIENGIRKLYNKKINVIIEDETMKLNITGNELSKILEDGSLPYLAVEGETGNSPFSCFYYPSLINFSATENIISFVGFSDSFNIIVFMFTSNSLDEKFTLKETFSFHLDNNNS